MEYPPFAHHGYNRLQIIALIIQTTAMETKKSNKANLETRKNLFFQIGLIFSLTVILVSFEWKNWDNNEFRLNNPVTMIIEEDLIEITKPEEPKIEFKKPEPLDLKIVDDDKKTKDFEINIESNDTTRYEEYYVKKMKPEEEEDVDHGKIFIVVEEEPQFKGGADALYEYLAKNMKYPKIAVESNIQGTVFVTFVIETDGSITDVKLLKGIGGGCDEEALRVVKNMPRWYPGKQRGVPVRVQYNLPVRFILLSN